MFGKSRPFNIDAICARTALYAVVNASALLAAVSVALMTVNIVIAIFGTLANGLVIIVHYRNRRLRTHQSTIFFLLAITDFGVTAFLQPLYVAFVWNGLSGNVTCVISALTAVLSVFFLELSLITIVILSLHTFITLALPYRSQNVITKSRLTKVIFISWLLIRLKNLSIFLDYKLNVDIHRFWMICSAIVVVVFTWCWTYKLVSRHRKAI